MLQQRVEGQREEDKDRRLQQVGHDAEEDKPGVRCYVPSRGSRVARRVYLGGRIPDGKAAKDANDQIEKPGDPCEALG